jgi:hypothetical protein
MIERMRCGALFVLVVAVAAACGTFGEADEVAPGPSTDAGDGAASPTEAGSDGAGDGSTDGPFPDSEAGADAGCGHTFCADFETMPYDREFAEHVMTSAAIELSAFTDPDGGGHALRTRIPAGAYGVGSNHYLRQKFTQTPKSVTVAFRVLVVKQPVADAGSTGIQVATIGWGGENGLKDRTSEIQVRIGPSAIAGKRDEESTDQYEVTLGNGAAWRNVLVEIKFEPSKKTTAKVSVDGVVSYDEPFTSDSNPDALDVGFGGAGLDSNQSSEILFDVDDVTVDIVQ